MTVKLFTFHPENLKQGLKLGYEELSGWKQAGNITVESRQTCKVFVAEIEEEELDYLRKIEWITPYKPGIYIHRGVRYDANLSVTLVAKLLSVSESSANNLLQNLIQKDILTRVKRGKKFYYKVKVK